MTSGFGSGANAELLMDPSVAVALLRGVARALGGEQDISAVLQRCAEAIVDNLDAAFARVWTLDASNEVLVLQASAGMYTHIDGGHARVPVGSFKIGRIAERREPHLSNDVLNDPELSDPEWARREGMVSFAGYPLLVGDQLLGVLALFARRPLSADVLGLLDAIADSVALGVRRSIAESELRLQGEIAEVLYRAGTAVARVHKLDSIVEVVTNLASELTGARFAIFEPTFRGTAIERHADITAEPEFGDDAPYHGMPEGHPPVRSYLTVPVISRTGEVFGGLLLGHEQTGVFDERAERLAVGVAGHASAAMDSARIFELEHRLALNFQRTLLAADPPEVPGIRLVQKYVPASELAEIGGDWHDVTLLPDGTVALTIGDVVGHDLRAAVTMGRLRNAIQLYALEGYGPAETLTRAERYLHRAGIEDLATVLHARYDPKRRHLVMATAGHLQPVIHRDGAPLVLPAFGGAMLGTSVPQGSELSVELQPSDVVVFYTDGLVERPGESIEDGIRRLHRAVAAALGSPGGAFCDTLIAALVGTEPRDDVAILAVFVDD